ncbi:rho GTPase-activating protein 23-like isoform X2 [Acipenser ruthenus]|uniref:rho GTPase-activating protein 23-like isoform X2 n=1 Tax=Acipenser ruthenus TaxID=7906 RepID=UPI0027409561|nr:rho GTPase-activating protein 23-like isoform X2 [Acipenser ruthenus]
MSGGRAAVAWPAIGARVPAPPAGGARWSFESPVGVDCSDPEPRCIWLAILRSVSKAKHSKTGAQGTLPPPRSQELKQQPAKGRRDGAPSSNENARPASGEGLQWPGPRSLVLHKNSQGFGFTLRHFIVYPPESAVRSSPTDEENGNGKGYQKGRLEPMDTIFVKNVRERGPAHMAGLCTGDRLVKVNGESILGKTYSQVIALIQNSDSVLELSIMPKDEDVLQLVSAYSQDAYLRGNDPFRGGAQNLPDPPPLCYPRKTYPGVPPQNQPPQHLDNWSCRSGSQGPLPPLDNRSGGESGGVGHSSPAHRTEEVQYGMTCRGGGVRSVSSSSSSATSPPPHQNHSTGRPLPHTQPPRQGSSPWASSETRLTSPPQPQPQPAPARRQAQLCQQALSDWYYSQQGPQRPPGHTAMPPRHRSFSHDRLGDPPPLSHFRGPHSASQDFLLHQHHWGHPSGAPSVTGDSCWSRAGRARSENQLDSRRELHGRSLETLDRAALSPGLERTTWLQQQCQHSRTSVGTSTPSNRERAQPQPQQPAQPGSRERGREVPRLPPQQSFEDPLVGYRSYSPSFYRKTDLLLNAHSFRDPSYAGPRLNWAPTPKTSPPGDPETDATSTPPLPLPPAQDGVRRPTNHERGVGGGGGGPREDMSQIQQQQEVVLRQKPPMGRRTSHGFRHPHYALSTDPQDSPAQVGAPLGDTGPRSANRGLPPLPIDDDSLASIPFIDEPTSPSADLRARHVPASSVVSSAISSAPLITTSPASPTFTFPLTRVFSHDCSSIKASRRSSYLLAITTERSKSCDEGLNAFRDEGRVFSRLPKRVKSFFTDGSLDSLGVAQDVRSKRHSTSELSNLTFSDVRREGWLHYKQILTEKGKKAGSGMRPWKRVFSVLRSHALFLYKDKREAVLFNSAHSEDEQPISIRGCLVDIAYSETKRKHSLRLTTQDFCEYLLQAEDRDDMLGWIKGIRENSRTGGEDSGFCGQALINKKLNDYKKQSPTGSKPDSSPKGTRMKPPFLTATGAPRSPKHDSGNKEDSSPPKSPWGINIMKKVKKSGPKVFGVRLEDCQHGVNEKFVPLIVELCCGLVEEMGLEYTGIYRVPGNNAVVCSLQEQLNKGSIDINPADEKWQDLNVISSLLKSFFRKLPEPLFTDDKYNDFIDANRMEDAGERLKTMKKLIRDLPDYYFHTLKFLVGHLKTVADHSDKNKMEPRNLALVFGPTLVRTSEDNMTDMVTHMPDRYKIVETLIQHHTWFFSEETDKDDKTPVDKADMQPAPNIDHLLPNIGRTGVLAEASDSTNSDSAKSKGSWGSKRELYSKELLALSILSAVTRKRKKRRNARVRGNSTDEDSEHEPIKTSHRGGRGLEEEEEEEEGAGARGDEEEREGAGEREEEEEEEETGGEKQRDDPRSQEVEEEQCRAPEEPKERPPPDARSIVSGYSTLSTLGGRGGEEADDERSELVSESGGGLPETDTESGFASHPQTQERPPKQDRRRRGQEQEKLSQQLSQQLSKLPAPAPPRSFLYSHCRPGATGGEVGPRSDTPSSLSSSTSTSSTAPRLHSRPSFNSRRLIQCDTLARKKLRGGEKRLPRPPGLEKDAGGCLRSSLGEEEAGVAVDTADSADSSRVSVPRAVCSNQESLRLGGEPCRVNEAASFSPASAGKPLPRPRSSADDMFGVGLRKPHSPETRRKKKAWRRHTVVVNISGMSDPQSGKRLSDSCSEGRPRSGSYGSRPQDSKPARSSAVDLPPPYPHPPGSAPSSAPQHTAASRFHLYL